MSKSGKCVTLRPDATGALVEVATTPRKAAPYAGSYGVWDDRVQSWVAGPCTLAQAVAEMKEGYVCRYLGEYTPGDLSRAEQTASFERGPEAG